jgi:hypothetical protein
VVGLVVDFWVDAELCCLSFRVAVDLISPVSPRGACGACGAAACVGEADEVWSANLRPFGRLKHARLI